MRTNYTTVVAYAGKEIVLHGNEDKHLRNLYRTINHHGMSFECFVYSYLVNGMFR